VAFNRPLLCPVAISGSEADVGSFPTVQDAFNALGGGVQILNFSQSAIYTISAALSINNRNFWQINGNGARIFMHSAVGISNTVAIFNCDDWVIDGLKIDANGRERVLQEVANNDTIRINDCKRFSLLRVHFLNGGNDCVRLMSGDTSGADRTRHPQDGLFFECNIGPAFRNGISEINGDNIQIIDNVFSACGFIAPGTATTGTLPRAGYDAEPNPGSATLGATQTLIKGNIFRVCARGVVLNGAVSHTAGSGIPGRYQACHDVTVEGNDFDGTGVTSLTGGNISNLGYLSFVCDGLLYQKNRFSNFGQPFGIMQAVALWQGNETIRNQNFTDNHFNNIQRGAGERCLDVESGTGGFLTISGNRAYSLSGSFVRSAASLAASIVITDNITVGALTSPTPTPPDLVGLGHCGVGVGARQTLIVENLTRQTINNNTAFSNILRLTHNPIDGATYWYFAVVTLDNSSVDTALSGKVRLRKQTPTVTTYGSIEFGVTAAGNKLTAMWGAEQVYGAAPPQQNIDLDIACQGNSIVGADDCRILALQKLAGDHYVSDDTTSTTPSPGFSTVLTLTQVLNGDYLFLCFAEVQGHPGNGVGVRALETGVAYGTCQIRQEVEPALTEFRAWATAFRLSGLAGSTTVEIQFAAESGTSVSIRKSRIFALNLDNFENVYEDVNRLRTTNATANPAIKSLVSTVTQAGEHLVFGGGIIDSLSVAQPVHCDLEQDGADISVQQEVMHTAGAGYQVPFFTFDKNAVNQATHQWRTQFWNGATQTTGFAQSFIFVLDLSTGNVSCGLDAKLKKALTKTASLDASITRDAGTKVSNIGAILQKTQTITTTLHAVITTTGATQKLASIDAVLKKALTKTAGTDAVLKKALTKTAGTDARLQGALTKTCRLDAELVGRRTASIDAVVLAGDFGTRTLTASLDAVLKHSWAQGLDAVITSWTPASATGNG